ncbi:hypothetical protein N0V90_003667 [Kalmusia sp. IMI 367209]|nr:hypothetical protein N0V90_003667 [Kalmusia sp. IMI 367209]
MNLCDVCSQLTLALKAKIRVQDLGPYDDILRKSHSLGSGYGGCDGCAFFCAVLHASDSWSSRIGELSGQVIHFINLRLDVKTPAEAKKGSRRYAADDLLLDICTEGEGLAKIEFGNVDSPGEIDCKRLVPVDPFDDKCFDLIHSWMNECTEHACCSKPEPVKLPKRVIEVPVDSSQPPRLRITNGELGQYVVLSHCWGSAGITKLNDALIPKYQNAIPLETLPKSFGDAVQITRRLGFRYIWIDALCISQNNSADWAEEAPKMSSYYGLSALMIAAAVAEDSSKGILVDRHVPYSPVMGKDKKYCLRQRLLRWGWDIERSVLASRGWCAQERMLAPRIVHYTKRQMIWECANGLKFEASGIEEKQVGSGQIDWHYSKGKLQPSVTRALEAGSSRMSNERESGMAADAEGTRLNTLGRVRTWQQCIDEYAPRNLTVSSDKLHAISGVAAILNYDGEMGTYLAGLWSKHIIAGLAWGRVNAVLTSLPAYRAPSWSWASLNGQSSSMILASPPELLDPPSSDTGRMWAAKFDLKLVEHHILLQDPRHVYGAVKEGSYIVVEGTCITRAGLEELAENVYKDQFGQATIAMDKNAVYDCPCCSAGGSKDEESSDGETDADATEQLESKLRTEGHFDLCLFLLADAWHNTQGFVDMLLLNWVDQETAFAERVGFARMNLWQKEDELEQFSETFCAAEWNRLRLKLV